MISAEVRVRLHLFRRRSTAFLKYFVLVPSQGLQADSPPSSFGSVLKSPRQLSCHAIQCTSQHRMWKASRPRLTWSPSAPSRSPETSCGILMNLLMRTSMCDSKGVHDEFNLHQFFDGFMQTHSCEHSCGFSRKASFITLGSHCSFKGPACHRHLGKKARRHAAPSTSSEPRHGGVVLANTLNLGGFRTFCSDPKSELFTSRPCCLGKAWQIVGFAAVTCGADSCFCSAALADFKYSCEGTGALE